MIGNNMDHCSGNAASQYHLWTNMKNTHPARREGWGNDSVKSTDRLGGECSRVEGAEPSDNPDESAVEGRASASTESFLEAGFLRVGTPSGQVHCGQDGVR